MTELTAFLASVYDSFSEAEMQALQHGQDRLAELLAVGAIPDDATVPVYHASQVAVTLDVGLVAEETADGTTVFVTEADEADASELAFTVDLFELLDESDLDGLDVADGAPRDEPSPAVPPSTGKPSTVANESIDVVEGIDPEYREVLEAAGVERLTDLVDRSPYALADAIAAEGVDVSPERTAEWLDEARGLIALLSEREGDLPVELVDGIGPVFGKRLRAAGVAELSGLADRSPAELAALVSTDSVTVSADRTAEWIEAAAAKLDALESVATVRDGDEATETDESTDSTDTTEDDS
jgi:predicted flap endonuclease-1-like 5' DNA nuclease